MKAIFLCNALAVLCFLTCLTVRGADKREQFDSQFREAQALFKQDKLAETYAAVQAAARIDPSRYEASGLAALVLLKDGKLTAARDALGDARKLAPAAAAKKLDEIGDLIEAASAKKAETVAATTPGKPTRQNIASGALTGAARRKFDTLMLIVGEADQAKSPLERRKLLEELMAKSAEFVRELPDVLQVWTLRAAAAMELEEERMAWEASSEMLRLGAENSDEPRLRQLLAKLDRKGWLRTPQQMIEMKSAEERRAAEARAAEENRIVAEREIANQREAEEMRRKAKLKVEADRREAVKLAAEESRQDVLAKRWENSLGMVFGPVPGTQVLFSIWETRVQDFEAFVQETGHDVTAGMSSLGPDSWKLRGDSWKSPGFTQDRTHPVVGVSWEDAQAFCRWLSKKEGCTYRLPADLEWSAAVGLPAESGATPKDRRGKIEDVFPWGGGFPPPADAGNYAGAEARDANWPTDFPTIDGFRDGYARTSPVGSFKPNRYGIYDLGGNVWEWCEDKHQSDQDWRVLRGGSWYDYNPRALWSSYRTPNYPGFRNVVYGFRVVVVVESR
jgi:hypothetical protein